jgi:hypothetical protein
LRAAADGAPQPGHLFIGSGAWVGANQFAAGLGAAIRHSRAYDQCMTLHGYIHN